MKEISAQEYAELAQPTSFMQTSEMAKQRRKQNQAVHFFQQGNEFVLLNGTPYPNKSSRYFNYSIWFSDHLSLSFLQGLKLWAKRNHGLSLTITPNLPIALRTYKGEITNKLPFNKSDYEKAGFKWQGETLLAPGTYKQWQYILPIDKSYTELLKSFKPKVRHAITTTEKTSIVLEKLSNKNLTEFTNTLASTAERRHFSSRDEKYYASMLDSFGDDAFGIIAYINPTKTRKSLNQLIKNAKSLKDGPDIIKKATKQLELIKNLETKTPIYAGFFIMTPRETVYLAGGGPDDYFSFSPVYAILNQAIKTSMDKKISRFNLYGVDATFDNPTGLLKFKQQFRGFVEQLPGDYRINFRPITSLALKAKNRLLKS